MPPQNREERIVKRDESEPTAPDPAIPNKFSRARAAARLGFERGGLDLRPGHLLDAEPSIVYPPDTWILDVPEPLTLRHVSLPRLSVPLDLYKRSAAVSAILAGLGKLLVELKEAKGTAGHWAMTDLEEVENKVREALGDALAKLDAPPSLAQEAE